MNACLPSPSRQRKLSIYSLGIGFSGEFPQQYHSLSYSSPRLRIYHNNISSFLPHIFLSIAHILQKYYSNSIKAFTTNVYSVILHKSQNVIIHRLQTL